MKLKFAKAAAVITLAAAATFAPIAAHAYPGADDILVSDATIEPGQTVSVTTVSGTFEPGEEVTVSLTGENASDGRLALVKAAVETATLGTIIAGPDGSTDVDVLLPPNAVGTYVITKTSKSLPAGISVTVSAVAAAGGTGGSGGGGGLPATGMDSGSLLGLWVGGGALVLAGGAVAVGAAVHRQRKQAA